jgi:hypothetical protein
MEAPMMFGACWCSCRCRGSASRAVGGGRRRLGLSGEGGGGAPDSNGRTRRPIRTRAWRRGVAEAFRIDACTHQHSERRRLRWVQDPHDADRRRDQGFVTQVVNLSQDPATELP